MWYVEQKGDEKKKKKKKKITSYIIIKPKNKTEIPHLQHTVYNEKEQKKADSNLIKPTTKTLIISI